MESRMAYPEQRIWLFVKRICQSNRLTHNQKTAFTVSNGSVDWSPGLGYGMTDWLTYWGRDEMDLSFPTTFWNLEWNVGIQIQIVPKFVHKGQIDNSPAVVQSKWWPSLLTHVYVIQASII